MKTLLFRGDFSQHGLVSTLRCLRGRSHSYRLHAVSARLSSTKVDSCYPAKDKRGVRERFAKVNLLFAKNGPSQIKEFRSVAISLSVSIYLPTCLAR